MLCKRLSLNVLFPTAQTPRRKVTLEPAKGQLRSPGLEWRRGSGVSPSLAFCFTSRISLQHLGWTEHPAQACWDRGNRAGFPAAQCRPSSHTSPSHFEGLCLCAGSSCVWGQTAPKPRLARSRAAARSGRPHAAFSPRGGGAGPHAPPPGPERPRGPPAAAQAQPKLEHQVQTRLGCFGKSKAERLLSTQGRGHKAALHHLTKQFVGAALPARRFPGDSSSLRAAWQIGSLVRLERLSFPFHRKIRHFSFTNTVAFPNLEFQRVRSGLFSQFSHKTGKGGKRQTERALCNSFKVFMPLDSVSSAVFSQGRRGLSPVVTGAGALEGVPVPVSCPHPHPSFVSGHAPSFRFISLFSIHLHQTCFQEII